MPASATLSRASVVSRSARASGGASSARRAVAAARGSASASAARFSLGHAPALSARHGTLSFSAGVASTNAINAAAKRANVARATLAVTTTCKRVLIVNTNGGGHSPIGFHFCKILASQGHKVTIMTVGTEDDKKMNKPPFTYFNTLRDAGVTTIWGNPEDVEEVAGYDAYDVVVDNNGKNMDTVGPVINFAKKCGARQFLFVSSCGVYKKSDFPPHIEGDAVDPEAGHVKVEDALAASGLSWASFRPQYLTGFGSNKDCEEWFFDRIARGRAVPIPGSGWQMSNIANCEDLGNMMAMAVTNADKADGVIFNCVHNKGVTLDGMVRACAKAMGKECPPIVHYDPAAVGGKKAFPFRPVHFYAQPQNATTLLGWKPRHTLESTLSDRWGEYQRAGRLDKSVDFALDDEILNFMK